MPLSGPGEGEGGLGTAGIDLCISNNDSEGYENVTKKVNSRRFKPYIISLIPSCLLREILANVFGVEFERNASRESSGKENEKSFCLVFPSSTKREFRHLHVMAVQRRQRNVQKSVMHVQSCCFANLNLLLFCRSVCVAVTDSE